MTRRLPTRRRRRRSAVPVSATIASASGGDRSPRPVRFAPGALGRRLAVISIGLTAAMSIVLLAPGMGEVRERLGGASVPLMAIAIGLELLSCLSYVLMFRPVFSTRLPWRTSTEIGLSGVAMGSIVPASGAGGLALGAWLLHREGINDGRIARRSVAFFLIKSSVNFVAVAAIGLVLAAGIVHAEAPIGLTLVPALISIALIALVLLSPRLGPMPSAGGRVRRLVSTTRATLIGGVRDASCVVRSGNAAVIVGAIGYWAFDNAVLWATFEALGDAPPLPIILMGYLIGQIGGLLPLPGGVGGIDGGLIGALVVFGAPVAATAAAVLAYRLILFWVPLVVGVPAFLSLYRREPREGPTEEQRDRPH